MIPERKCLGCRDSLPRQKLIRILVEHKSKTIHLQPTSKLQGRSAYICYKKECIQNCLKKSKIQKSLKKNINQEIIEMLQKIAN